MSKPKLLAIGDKVKLNLLNVTGEVFATNKNRFRVNIGTIGKRKLVWANRKNIKLVKEKA